MTVALLFLIYIMRLNNKDDDTSMDPHISELFKDELITCLELSVVEAEQVIKILPEIQALRLSAALRFKRIADFYVSEKASGLRGLLDLFTFESLIFYKKGQKDEKFKWLLREHISSEDKIELLSSFTFSEPYKFKTDHGKCRHLMYPDFLRDMKFRNKNCASNSEPEHCSLRLCYCDAWLKTQASVDAHLDLFTERLLEMRNAFAHEAFPIFLLPRYEGSRDAATYSSTILDCYPLREEKMIFRSYECCLDPAIYFRITKACMKNFIKALIENQDISKSI